MSDTISVQEITPMMSQYQQIKKNYPDAILFYRLGDFYEMFYEDAKLASKLLEITLTTRDKNKENSVPMCGIPYHAANSYLGRLLKGGYKVVICDQVENARPGKLVKREVTRIITPGTILDTAYLDSKENNFLSALYPAGNIYGFALIDLSTGDFKLTEFKGNLAGKELKNEIERARPRELLIPESAQAKKNSFIPPGAERQNKITWTTCEDWIFASDFASSLLREHFKTISLDGFGCKNFSAGISAAGALIYYLKETQKKDLKHINSLIVYHPADYMYLDATALKNLELVRTWEGEKKGSILDLLDLTLTAMGGRKIKEWILRPLLEIEQINQRLKAVEKFKERAILRAELRDILKEIYDLKRIMSRLNLGWANAKDLIALKNSLGAIKEIKSLLRETEDNFFLDSCKEWDDLTDIYELIARALDDFPALFPKDGKVIRDGFDPKLDRLRLLKQETKKSIARIEQREKERTGINTLKIGYNKIYGYYLEVTKKNLKFVPEDYIRKQSLVNTERFISQELKEFEAEIETAKSMIYEIESDLFNKIQTELIAHTVRVQRMAEHLASLDSICALAEVAARYDYVKPRLNDGDTIKIAAGRHPIIEQIEGREKFIPNDTFLDCQTNQIAVITGPNMAGKSTYMRQVALIVLLAQIGSFVPAKEAVIGIVDRIFTRIGAQDDLLRKQSTFMVEMTEAANILNHATARSLIILDEIGRGTSTYDGLSIAWAIIEYLHERKKKGAKTLFATHYHELTALSQHLERVKNYNIAVREWNDEIIFLRRIIEGGTDKSYGIQVAKLAGLPAQVLTRAREILSDLERRDYEHNYEESKKNTVENTPRQLDLFHQNSPPLLEKIKQLNPDNLTPREALDKLYELKELL